MKDYFSSFEELLSRDKSVTVHQRNVQILPNEMHKILNGLSPDIMQDIFETQSNYYTGNAPAFSSRNIKAVRHNLQTIFYVAPKQVTTLSESKIRILIWKLENCSCRPCRTYLPLIGFIRQFLLK